MKELLDDLLQRWEQAFDDIHLIDYYGDAVNTIQYSSGSRYDISKFNRTSFPSGGPMIEDSRGLEHSDLYKYGFNETGLPCYVEFGHVYNKVAWKGFYTYSGDEVKYIEFCLNTGVPSVFARMVFLDGRKVMLQHLVVNSRGSGYPHLTPQERINELKNDESSFFITATSFKYEGDRINTSSSIHNTPGLGMYTTTGEYIYDETGVLEKIRTFFEDGRSQLSYCRNKENLDLAALIDKLASAMASAIVEVLTYQNIQEPIALLELYYHLGDNYHPILSWQSTKEIEEKIQRGDIPFINDKYGGPGVDITPFEDLFVLLEQMMNENDDMEPGSVMLRKACTILTEGKLFGKIEATEDFAAYAIDWSIEGHNDEEFEEILSECGVTQDVIAIWRQKGMLPL